MLIKALLADRGGGSATEFAVILPVLAFLVLGILDGWSLASSTLNMRAAVQAGARYLMTGGFEESALRSVIKSAWANAPSDAEVTVEKQCRCASSASDCLALCESTLTTPATYYTVRVAGTWQAPVEVRFLSTSLNLTQEQVVRVR